jgi:hypothetical protein
MKRSSTPAVVRQDHEPPFAVAQRGWRYHHLGIPTTIARPNERHLPHLKIHVCGFDTSPYGIEWIRFDPDCVVSDAVRTLPHIAFEVDDLDVALIGQTIIGEVSSPSKGVRVAMIVDNGAPIELLEFRKSQGIESPLMTAKENSMTQPDPRMTDGNRTPSAKNLSAWMGSANYKRWVHLVHYIEKAYPGVFTPEWLFGGKKYGWGLRFKKSKSFCTLIPERDRLAVQIVFGGPERAKVESIANDLTPAVRKAYQQAKTFHDGKWLLLRVDRDELLHDIQVLLGAKRRVPAPKNGGDRSVSPR